MLIVFKAFLFMNERKSGIEIGIKIIRICLIIILCCVIFYVFINANYLYVSEKKIEMCVFKFYYLIDFQIDVSIICTVIIWKFKVKLDV